MAQLDVKKSAKNLAIDSSLITKIDVKDIRCDEGKVDKLVTEVAKPGIGKYEKISNVYQKAADLCARTLKNKKIDVQSIKKELKLAKKKCLEQAKFASTCAVQIISATDATVDIISTLEKN